MPEWPELSLEKAVLANGVECRPLARSGVVLIFVYDPDTPTMASSSLTLWLILCSLRSATGAGDKACLTNSDKYCGVGGSDPSCTLQNCYEEANFIAGMPSDGCDVHANAHNAHSDYRYTHTHTHTHAHTSRSHVTLFRCFITDTTYASGPGSCEHLKLYNNEVITYSSGGVYQYQEARVDYFDKVVDPVAEGIADPRKRRYEEDYGVGLEGHGAGGGGGNGFAHSQMTATETFFVMQKAHTSDNPAFDFYELKGGIYTFGYYNCSKVGGWVGGWVGG